MAHFVDQLSLIYYSLNAQFGIGPITFPKLYRVIPLTPVAGPPPAPTPKHGLRRPQC